MRCTVITMERRFRTLSDVAYIGRQVLQCQRLSAVLHVSMYKFYQCDTYSDISPFVTERSEVQQLQQLPVLLGKPTLSCKVVLHAAYRRPLHCTSASERWNATQHTMHAVHGACLGVSSSLNETSVLPCHRCSAEAQSVCPQVNVGPTHNIFLSSYIDYTTGSAQYNWLLNDLQSIDRSKTPW